jgi:ligand-binding sensor domain-containing protein
VGARNGLDAGIVSTVYIDRVGFIWTATSQGLVRFDGYSTKLLSRDPADPTSLSDNVVRAICEDCDGGFWVGTNSGGLNLLDRASGKFTRHRHDPADSRSIDHDVVFSITEGADDTLWVGTFEGGLLVLDGSLRALRDEWEFDSAPS